MSINTAHANNGVLIHAGEAILLFSENVTMEFSGQDNPLFRGTKNGNIYLTTHRMIFNAKKFEDAMKSFSFPFICLTDVEIEQPMFGANYIRGKVRAQDNGNFVGEAKFKLLFKSGGAIDFAQAMLRAAHMAKNNAHNAHNAAPPPYTPPSGEWHEAPPPAYSPNPAGYYGWLPNNAAFPNGPPPNSVFMTDNPPPYPGIVPQSPMPTANGYPGQPPNYGYSPPQSAGDYPPQSAGGYPPQSAGGYPPQSAGGYPPQSAGGYPPQSAGGYPPQSAGGYPPQSTGGYPPQPGYPPQNDGGYAPQPGAYPQVPGGYPQWGNPNLAQGGYAQPSNPGYSPAGNSMGFAAPPNSKEAEAAQSSFYNPSQPQQPYAPPPGYNEPPPSYGSLNPQNQKKDQ